MPFQSKAQSRKCYAMKARGEAGSWNCDEFAHETNYKKLPEKKPDSDSEKQSQRRAIMSHTISKEAAVRQMTAYLDYLSGRARPGEKLATSSRLHKLAEHLRQHGDLDKAIQHAYPEKKAGTRAVIRNRLVRGLARKRAEARKKKGNALMGYGPGAGVGRSSMGQSSMPMPDTGTVAGNVSVPASMNVAAGR